MPIDDKEITSTRNSRHVLNDGSAAIQISLLSANSHVVLFSTVRTIESIGVTQVNGLLKLL